MKTDEKMLNGIDLKNSIILLDKPEGKTSFQTINEVKRLIKSKKIGHSGTLDKFASGLLVVCTDYTTKLTRYFLENDKRYTGVIQYGLETDTCDTEGTVINETDSTSITEKDIFDAIEKFKGEIDQVPPAFSALKIKGKRASDLARKGESVNLDKRTVVINDFKITDIDLNSSQFSIDVACSKGTYIRSLARDIGKELGVGAHLKELRRTRSGCFSIEDAVRIDELKELLDGKSINKNFVKRPEQALDEYNKIFVNEQTKRKILNGVFFQKEEIQKLSKDENATGDNDIYIILDDRNNLISIAKINFDDWVIKYLNVFKMLNE